jgi:hypothetical protein
MGISSDHRRGAGDHILSSKSNILRPGGNPVRIAAIYPIAEAAENFCHESRLSGKG